MELQVPRHGSVESVSLDDRKIEQVITPNSVSTGVEADVLRAALNKPINAPGFGEFLQDKKNILLVVNDATRPTPTRAVLEIIYPVLEKKNFSILIATGSHRGPTEEEYGFIYGDLRDVLKEKTFVHDAKTSACFILGRTRHGNEIRLNRLVKDADAIIPIGSVEPHYFAGYTGGRKSFMPGVADYACITANHRLALSPGAGTTVLKGNPVAEELDDVEEILISSFNIFSIMTVLDAEHRTYAAAAGDLRETYQHLIPKTDEVFVVPIARTADIVVTIALHPTDIDLYQSLKALENGKFALREGGIIILVSACRDGIGQRAFFDLLASEDSCAAVLQKMAGEYRLGYHKAGKMAEIGVKADMWAVTPLDPDLVRSAHMTPFSSVSDALREAIKIKGPQAKVIFLMDGGHVVPRLAT